MTDKVERGVATAEVERWLDHKKVGKKKRETYKDQIETLIDAVAEGSLVLTEGFEWVQELKFAIGNAEKLTYKPRVDLEQIEKSQQNSTSSNSTAIIRAYISVLTSQTKQVIGKLDTEDYTVGSAITIFFL